MPKFSVMGYVAATVIAEIVADNEDDAQIEFHSVLDSALCGSFKFVKIKEVELSSVDELDG